MCGIAGVLGNLHGVDKAAMLAALAHRGPDDEGQELLSHSPGEEVWFGHRRLSILDLSSGGHQPMASPEGRYRVVFNGEIYNFRELRTELEAAGRTFRSGSDTEVLLAAWAQWGDGALGRLRGMFAFALWDESERALVLARDRLGEKPLYFHQGPARLVFASEVRAVLASGVVPRELDSEGLDSYLTFGGVADPFTLVRGVRSVGAGEVVVVRGGTVTRRAYWSLKGIEDKPWGRRAELVAQTRSRLEQSLRRCMVADVPVAVLLSGGIDSSANVALLASQRWANLNTFSVVFGDADAAWSEAPYSDLVARTFATRHTQFEVSLADAKVMVTRGVAAMDQPSYDGVNTFLVCESIRRAGIKVAVSGQGSDELFLGYNTRRLFPWAYRAGRLLPTPLKDVMRRVLHGLPVAYDSPPERVAETLVTADALAGAYLAQHSVFSHASIERLRGARRPPPTRFVADVGGRDPLDRLSRLELAHYLKNMLLRDGDQMSMAHSIELRAPFLDADLVELVVGTPPAWRLDARRNKPLLLDAVGDALPRAVWDRPKRGFVLPYDRWLREGLEINSPAGPEIGLDPTAVEGVRRRFEAGIQHARWWSLVVLSAWVRRERMGTSHL